MAAVMNESFAGSASAVHGEPAEEQFIIDGLRAAAVIVGMVRLPSGLTAY